MQRAQKITKAQINKVCNGKGLGIKVRYFLGTYNAYKTVKGHNVFIGSTQTQKAMTALIADYIRQARQQMATYCAIYNAIGEGAYDD